MRKTRICERPTRRSELAGWYARALADQQASGVSVADYATKIGVAVPTLYLWRRRLGGVGLDRESPAKLVEVTARPAAPSDGDGALVVRVEDGRRSIVVPRGFEFEELRRLLAVLESC